MQDELGLWLVFCDEGTSLHTLMYSPAISGPHDTSQGSPHAKDAPESVQQPSAEQSTHRRGAAQAILCLDGILTAVMSTLATYMPSKHI